MDFLNRGEATFLQTHLAEGMSFGISVAYPLPCPPVLSTCVRGSFIFVVAVSFFFHMDFAILSAFDRQP